MYHSEDKEMVKKQYEVSITLEKCTFIEVDAESPDEAMEKARELIGKEGNSLFADVRGEITADFAQLVEQ